MEKRALFADYWGYGWPSIATLEPYFLVPKGHEWFYTGGNDSAGLDLFGVDDTDHLPSGRGRIDVRLDMWGNPEHGVLLIYSKLGGANPVMFSSKGDLSRLKEWVRTLHDDQRPVGLYIPFTKAWLAVKEFMETEGQLPKSIEWINNRDLPEGIFPDP